MIAATCRSAAATARSPCIEVALRLALRESTPDGGTDGVSLEADTSFSAQIGPVYFRLDRLGLGLVLDTSQPPAERNLRFVDARLGINPPLGIAVQVDAKLVSGGGTIFHDPAQGHLLRRARPAARQAPDAEGVRARRHAQPRRHTGVVVHHHRHPRRARDHARTGHRSTASGVLYASDRTFDESAMRAALPTGQLKHLLFPADPVHHTAEILRPLATFFPAKHGSYLLGILVKLTFGAPPIVRLDLALIAQWGDVGLQPADRARPAQLDPARPSRSGSCSSTSTPSASSTPAQGTAALDAVLVDSKLCGRFPLTGAAAFRRVAGVKGFALAVGGFHPRVPGAARVPRPAAGHGGPHQRRQPEADLPGLPRDHRQHRAVRRRARRCTPRRAASASRATSASTC